MQVKGVLGSITFDGEWIFVTKKEIGKQAEEHRLNVRSITGTTFKRGTWLFHGYVQFLLPGSLPAPEKKGLMFGGRPPYSDRNSLSLPRRSNKAAEKLVAAVEEARIRLSP